MKRYSFFLLVALLALGVSAFTGQKSAAALPTINWVNTESNGDYPMVPDLFTGTVAEARVHYGCPTDGNLFCAKQVDGNGQFLPGGQTIKRN